MFLPFSSASRSWEPHAIRLRNLVPTDGNSEFDPFRLAPKVGLRIQEVSLEGLTADEQRHLRGSGRNHWSGGIYPVPLPDGTYLCMLNPDQSEGRRKITLMEEICHAYFDHKPTKIVVQRNGILARDYNSDQEKEAYGVGSAVLLPWASFYHRLDAGLPLELIAEEFGVTMQLVQYRIKTTGASRLYLSRVRQLRSQAANG